MSNFTNKTTRGFSIIEGLVATLIVALALVAIASIFPFTAHSNKTAEQTSLASTVAKAKLEDLTTTSYDELGTGTLESWTAVTANQTSPLYGFQRQTVVTLLDTNLNTSASDIGLKQITVTVRWPNRQGGYSTFADSTIRSRL